jgi:hypothetical protein
MRFRAEMRQDEKLTFVDLRFGGIIESHYTWNGRAKYI